MKQSFFSFLIQILDFFPKHNKFLFDAQQLYDISLLNIIFLIAKLYFYEKKN